jgi:hypothetical protein
VLDAGGLPAEWTKFQDGVPVLRVEYRGYVAVPAGPGATVRLPARIRVYAADAVPRIVLGLREWSFEADAAAPITFVPPPEVLSRFQPQ